MKLNAIFNTVLLDEPPTLMILNKTIAHLFSSSKQLPLKYYLLKTRYHYEKIITAVCLTVLVLTSCQQAKQKVFEIASGSQ